MRDAAINRIMTTNPITVKPNDPVSKARKILESGDVHHLPVVSNDILVGILSSSDLLKSCLPEGGPDTLPDVTVGQVMQGEPLVLESGASLRDAAAKLSMGAYHALPVVDADGTLAGIVTTTDLVAHLLQQLPRGDGSIKPERAAASRMSDAELLGILKDARHAAHRDDETGRLAQAVLHYRDRNNMLESACTAAELYLRSGQGAHEHGVMVKCLSDLQK